MNIKSTIKLSLFFFAVLFTSLSFADYTFPYNDEWWINAGLGASIGHNNDVSLPANIPGYLYSYEKSQADDVSGPSAEISLNFVTTPNQLLTFRYFGSSNLFADPGNGYLNEGAVLYGLMAKAQYGYISGSAGLSVVNTGYYSGTDSFGVTFNHFSQNTVGLPLEVQAFFTPFKYVGIGVVGVGDINSRAPIAAGLLELQIGNLI